MIFWIVFGATLLTFVFRVPHEVKPWLVGLVAVVAMVAGAEGPSFG